MSHITRRKFLAGSAALIGTVALPPITYALPAPLLPTAPIAAATVEGPYAAFAQAMAGHVLREIKEASVMRQLMSIEKLRAKAVQVW